MGVTTLIDLLRERAASQPHDPAFTFLESGEQEGPAMTWSTVEARSRAIGAAVQAHASAGARVLVLLPPCVDFVPAFFGVLYGGGIAIPAYPPSGARADRTSTRLRGMIADAGVSLVVSSAPVRARLSLLATLVPELEGLPWIDIDTIDEDAAEAWRVPTCQPETIALLQYTSGSTAAPRGVMVSHGNLLHNLALSASLACHSRESVSVSWLPVNHDMGLIDGVLQPAFSGFHCYLMAPAAFLQRPARWVQAISRYGATHSGGPNFAYDLCVRRICDADRQGLDLSTWQTAYNGSEPVRRSTMENFHQAFAACGFRWQAFRPAYGLAESTLLVTSTSSGDAPAFLDVEPGRSLVSSGVVASNPFLRIVDPATLRPVRDGAVGEIWVRSGSVAAGYWNRPRETAATFGAFLPPEGGSHTSEGPYLRTGDLGCVVEGHLFVTGRLKDVLIVRGVKHYPQDLEATAEQAHPAVRPGCCAAFAVQADGEERVALVAEVEPKRAPQDDDLQQAALAIRRAIAEMHQVTPASVALVSAGTLPKTTSGKLQRFLCRDGVLGGEFDLLAAS